MPASLPTTIDGVIERLRAIQRSLPVGDGVAVFNRMYLDVTERVGAAINADDFADAGFMVELDVRFANFWLGAYDAVAGRPKAAVGVEAVVRGAGHAWVAADPARAGRHERPHRA